MASPPCARRTPDTSPSACARATACDAGRNPDAAKSPPSYHEPRSPRAHTAHRRTDSPAESPRINRADHPPRRTRCASPSTATKDQGPTEKDRCPASPQAKPNFRPLRAQVVDVNLIGESSSAYAAILRPRRVKARVWVGVGLDRIVVGRASPKRTLLRVRLARSCRRVRKLWTGWPSSVRLLMALRRAAGETLALATGEERWRPRRRDRRL